MTDTRTRRAPPTNVVTIHEDESDPEEEYDDGSTDELDESRGPLEDSGCTRSDSSDEDDLEIEDYVAEDMQKFEDSFKGITKRYRLLNRIGEGTFSTVYKAEDLLYEEYRNDWDIERTWSPAAPNSRSQNSRPHHVAIKKIYVTSSPLRIMNELELLHDLRNCDAICPLITAFRCHDQVIAILPYFRHQDFRSYFRELTFSDMRPYFRSLFTALSAVHEHGILHRDIKPTNFLYYPRHKHGVLVDFGLAERQSIDQQQPCMCQLESRERKRRIADSYCSNHDPMNGYPKDDRRPSLRANRAGTRGFRAPEVLFKCTAQTTKVDIWSAGVILLTIMARRFPFFNSADDIDAVIELATVFGRQRMRLCALLHGQAFDTNIPTITEHGYSLEKIMLWSNNRPSRDIQGNKLKLSWDERTAVDFLEQCLHLDPYYRISAKEALQHPFVTGPVEEESSEEEAKQTM